MAEAAARLGVSAARVRQRIQDGSLPAERIGTQWTVHPQALEDGAAKRSRPMSRRMAWALIRMLAGEEPQVSAAERLRLRKCAARLRDSDGAADLLRAWGASRAERVKYSIAAADLDELRSDKRLQLSGLSAPDSGVVARSVVEAYVADDDVQGLIDDYFLVRPDDHRGNVILHVIDHEGPYAFPLSSVSWPLLAIDLAEHSGTRERERAAELVREKLRVRKDVTASTP